MRVKAIAIKMVTSHLNCDFYPLNLVGHYVQQIEILH
jgi:hypothetical protein